jgi:hypothetical protein
MIDTLFLAVTVIAVGLVMYWMLTNDAAGNTRPTKGFFALRRALPGKRSGPAPPRRPPAGYRPAPPIDDRSA